jgi:hypothetical protein
MKNIFPPKRRKEATTLIAALALLCASAVSHADERGDLEQLRATTLSLIEALVEGGVISRDKADKLLQDAEAKAKVRMAANAPLASPAMPVEIGKDGKRVVRVPYVPESMKREIREQVKQEVLAQAREERWANPGALPEWLDRFHFEGDLRLRADSFALDRNNTPAGQVNLGGGTLTRGADLVGANGNIGFGGAASNTNTQEDFTRLRLRARFGAGIKVSDKVSAGFRIATGSTSEPTSTNQTLGQGFNKYALALDRAYIKLQPFDWLSLSGGRIANPFVGTDLLWADDLGFEGVSGRVSQQLAPGTEGYITAGWFPLRADSPLQSSSRHLSSLQAGLNWKGARGTELKLAAALHQFHGITGAIEDDSRYNFGNPAVDYGIRQEYPASMRRRGNTLFVTNARGGGDPWTTTYWGLASEFRELNLTASVDIATFDPVRIVLTADYVKNLAFDRDVISQRTGAQLLDGRGTGYQGSLLVGYPTMKQQGDWNVSLTYRWLGSDAVVDAFRNGDFGLGGTNNKGFVLGGSFAIDKNTWLAARWMSSSLIDSMAPRVAGATVAATKFNVDLLQIDLNTRF